MRHSYSCPLRWGDMDSLQHVNNVVYADYAREARWAMVRDGLLDGARAHVTGLQIDFVDSLVFRPDPVKVESRLADDGVLHQEVVDVGEEGTRRTYVRLAVTLGERPDGTFPVAPSALPGRRPVHVRQRDLGPYGEVDEVALLDLFQEGRIAYIDDIGARDPDLLWVAGRSTTTVLGPVRGEQRYEQRLGVVDLTRSTFTLRAELVDVTAGQVLATSRTTLVGYDQEVQRSRPLSDHERSNLARHMHDGDIHDGDIHDAPAARDAREGAVGGPTDAV